MSIKSTISAVIGLVLLICWVGMGFTISKLIEEKQALQVSTSRSSDIVENAIPLLIAIKEIKIEVVQVQQWLTDISATRGLPGFDDGFVEAAAHADAFRDEAERAKGYAAALEMNDVLAQIDELETAFIPYYEMGQVMARAYIDTGPEGGNLTMAQFDEVAQVMGDQTNALTEMVQTKTSKTLTEASAAESAMRAANAQLIYEVVVILAACVFLSILGVVYLFRSLTSRFNNLQHDVAAVTSRDDSITLLLDPNGKDEFGQIAKAFLTLRVFCGCCP